MVKVTRDLVLAETVHGFAHSKDAWIRHSPCVICGGSADRERNAYPVDDESQGKKTMKSAFTFVIALLLMLTYAHSMADSPDESSAEQRANLAAEFAQCSSFYTIVAEGVRRHDMIDLADSYKEASRVAFYHARAVSNVGVTVARVRLAQGVQLEEMKGDFSNTEILILKYSDRCKDLMENTAERLLELLE